MSDEVKEKIKIEDFIKKYWNYYLKLENSLISTEGYVMFDIKNFKTFSFEYLKLFQTICSEVDVVAKIIANYFDEEIKDVNIKKWWYTIHNNFENVEETTLKFNDSIIIKPWENFEYEKTTKKNKNGQIITGYRLVKNKESKFWWLDYQKVKHERTAVIDDEINYEKANLENIIYSLGGLYSLEILFMKHLTKEKINFKESQLFAIEE